MLVCPLVFKTSEGGEELPRWVRFPHIPAKQKALRRIRSAFVFSWIVEDFLLHFDGGACIGQHFAHDGAPGRKGTQLLQQCFCISLG